MGTFDWKDSGNENEGSYMAPSSQAYAGAAPAIPMTGTPAFGPMGSAIGVNVAEEAGDFSASSTIGSKPTPQGDDFLYGDASVNRLGIPGLEVGAGLSGSAMGIADLIGIGIPTDMFSGRATVGGWDTEDGSRAGLRGSLAALPKQDGLTLGNVVSPLVGSIIPSLAFDPTALTAEVEGPNAEAELSLGTDGFTVGAQTTAVGAGVTMGDFGDTGVGSDSEQQLRVAGNVGGGGGAFRLHWADEDGDGAPELGFGLDAGAGLGGSMDFKTEDPLRSLLGFGNPLATSVLPEGNLTYQGLDAVDGMIMNGGDAVVDWVNDLFTDENQGLEPL